METTGSMTPSTKRPDTHCFQSAWSPYWGLAWPHKLQLLELFCQGCCHDIRQRRGVSWKAATITEETRKWRGQQSLKLEGKLGDDPYFVCVRNRALLLNFCANDFKILYHMEFSFTWRLFFAFFFKNRLLLEILLLSSHSTAEISMSKRILISKEIQRWEQLVPEQGNSRSLQFEQTGQKEQGLHSMRRNEYTQISDGTTDGFIIMYITSVPQNMRVAWWSHVEFCWIPVLIGSACTF